MSQELTTIEFDLPAEYESRIFGPFDCYLKKINHQLAISVTARNGVLNISGSHESTEKAVKLFTMLLALAKRGGEITDQSIDYSLSLLKEDRHEEIIRIDNEVIIHTIQGRPIKPKTIGQKEYIDSIRNNMITFGIGPAGTGKTYLAMAMAISAFKAGEVTRIILTRPAIEAGEKLGFLPGDLQSKIDPYLRPLYDALYEIMGAETFIKNTERGLIEVAPLAYMRGRTLDNAFIILDEAQNTTPSQMKMFLTRVGFGSKVVVTGDRTQKDLPTGTQSGLDVAMKVLSKIDEIGFSELTSRDVVRHPLVQKIVEAYDKYEAKTESGRKYSKDRVSLQSKTDKASVHIRRKGQS